MRDWVYAWRIHHGYPVTLPECPEERRWIVEDLVRTWGWAQWPAVNAAGVHTGFRLEVAA